jgi:hypothetical protein
LLRKAAIGKARDPVKEGSLAALGSSGERYFEQSAWRRLDDLPRPDLAGFEEGQVRFASRAWTMRGQQEHRSANVFAEATSLLVDTGAPLDVVSALTRVVSDELSHTELCVRMTRAFATDPPSFTRVARETTAPESRRARALRILLVEGAMGETISCALFSAGCRAATEPCTRAALARILRDEATHAHTCWAALATLLGRATPSALAALEEEATRALGSIETTQMVPVLERIRRKAQFDPAWEALGVLVPEKRANAFYGAIERRVVPSLTRLGLDGERVWQRRHTTAAARHASCSGS